MKVNTVKIADENRRGFKIINESDFKKSKHKAYKEGGTKRELLINEAELLGIDGASDMTIAKLEEAIKAEADK